MKKIIFATVLFCGVCVFGSPQGNAQDTPSQPIAADTTADALTDQQLALLLVEHSFYVSFFLILLGGHTSRP